jgi:HTH-type transcriptional regulator / antitoxin HipB
MDFSLHGARIAYIVFESMRSQGQPGTGETLPLGLIVRGRRKALRLSQAELAALAGVGLAFLYELEHGKPSVRVDKVLAVLEVLGLELHVREGKERMSAAASLRAKARP